MTMLEKAARALCKADGMQPDWSHPNPEMGKLLWELYVPRVRAVLMAVRVDEPVYMVEQRFNDRIDAILNEDQTA